MHNLILGPPYKWQGFAILMWLNSGLPPAHGMYLSMFDLLPIVSTILDVLLLALESCIASVAALCAVMCVVFTLFRLITLLPKHMCES
jgi:hypothetical protein